MGRPNKIWWWEERGVYCVKIDGKRHNLGPDKDQATTKFHELMAKPKATIVRGTVAEIIEKFMDWAEVNRPASYEWYQKRIDKLYPMISDLRISDLRPLHIQEELDKHKWSEAFKAGCVTAVKRAFNFAVEQGYIEKSPLRGLRKPDPGRREEVIFQEEFDGALIHAKNQNFKDIASFIWYTGCRPEESVKLTAAMVDLPNARIIIPRPDAKKKKRPRVIYLCPESRAIVERNMQNTPTLFVNTQGRPWTAYSIACTWGRIAKKTGKKLCSYSLRHSYATHKLKMGTDTVTLAHLMGHEDTAMLSRVYAHVGMDPAYMAQQASRNAVNASASAASDAAQPVKSRGKRSRRPQKS